MVGGRLSGVVWLLYLYNSHFGFILPWHFLLLLSFLHFSSPCVASTCEQNGRKKRPKERRTASIFLSFLHFPFLRNKVERVESEKGKERRKRD